MPIGKYRIEGSQVEIECEMLDLPVTMPDDGYGYQLLSVVEDMHQECKMHVVIEPVFVDPLSWGIYLVEIARLIARDYADDFKSTEAEVFAAICEGIKKDLAE